MSALQEQYAAVNPAGIPAARWGFWSSLLTAIVTVVSFAIAIFTPPRSGPFCLGMCVGYPYTDTAPFFPRDYLWIFPALLLTPLLLIVCACAEILGRSDRMFLSRIALAFAIVCTAIITLDYFIQIEVIQPSLLRNEADGIGLISQYNPHGLFIALEDLGYLMMSAVFFFLGAFLSGQAGLERALRLLLLAGGVLGLSPSSECPSHLATGLKPDSNWQSFQSIGRCSQPQGLCSAFFSVSTCAERRDSASGRTGSQCSFCPPVQWWRRSNGC